ncbi:MAG: ATP-binding protein [Deltaproteobacteria bacterium]|nr:MAG: ATP-binding protein [Deltaproteobacteria bacterium]
MLPEGVVLETLKEIILDFQEEKLNTGIKRHLEYEFIKGKAFVCIGVRRCGKSTLLYQIIAALKAKSVKQENILYLNLFDDRLNEIRRRNLPLVLEAYYSLYPEKKGTEEVFCFFDEIQEVENWEPFVDRILRTENCCVFLSGSSSKMLSTEIATQMRGRSLTWELFPFSFKEFLDFRKIDYTRLTSKNRLLIKKVFDEYFIKGGFPEVRNVNDKIRIMILQEYYKTILHRDIINRFEAIHPQAVIQAGHRLIGSISSLYSINRITDYLKSLGYKVSKNFVSSCINWFEDAYFLFSVPIFSPSVSKQNANAKKIYCIDHSMAGSVSPKIMTDNGHKLENMIFLHLRRHSDEIYYYRTAKRHEVDFVCIDKEYNKNLVQVSLAMKDPKTRSREITSLLCAMEELGLGTGKIITLDEEKILKEGNKTVEIIPAWKYLLG